VIVWDSEVGRRVLASVLRKTSILAM